MPRESLTSHPRPRVTRGSRAASVPRGPRLLGSPCVLDRFYSTTTTRLCSDRESHGPRTLGWVMTLRLRLRLSQRTVRRRAKSAAHAYPIALPVRGAAARPHEQRARLRPVKQSVRAIRGAGQLRRRHLERPRRVWIAGQHAQGVGPVDRRLPRDAERALRFRATPASSRTARSIARRRREGRRSGASPPCRTAASCPGRRTARSRRGTRRALSASAR